MLNERALLIGTEKKARVIEDKKTFSYKLNLKNPDGSPAYEDAHFSQQRTYDCMAGDEDEAAREAFAFCVSQVNQDIREFLEMRRRKQPERKPLRPVNGHAEVGFGSPGDSGAY
jgi:hypothetical protein